MSETWTAGPWQASETELAKHVLNDDDELIEIWGVDEDGDTDYRGVRVGWLFLTHNGADTSLITAAPELAAALRRFVDGHPADCGCPVVKQARAALAKARGEKA